MPDTPAGFESVAYAADTAMVEAMTELFDGDTINAADLFDVIEINELCAA